MSFPAPDSFRTQVVLIAVAALSMAALAILLVQDALASAEATLVREASQQCSTASAELARQLSDRALDREEAGAALPSEAQDISLRGLAAAVLRSYEGVAGGYAIPSSGIVLGAATAGQLEPPALETAELALIRSTAAGASAEKVSVATQVVGQDVIVVAARASDGGLPVAWASKRILGVRDPGLARRRWWLAALVLLAVFAVGGVVAMSIRLRRGVELINKGLGQLEQDFSFRLPRVAGDFGRIAQAVNRMAERRASLESSIRQQDRLAALGKAVAGVAHEIRNPLNSMRLSLELAQRRLRKSGGSGEEIKGAVEEVDRLDGIVNRLLTFGKPDGTSRSVQDLRPLIDRAARVLEPQAAANDIRVDLRLPDQPLDAVVDAGQIEQVLINVLLNGLQASPQGSELQVIADRRDDQIQVGVRDFGEGVPAEIRDHLFDPYFTTRRSGNGLGLAVSREFMKNHGGNIELGQTDRGAHFIITLPAARRSA